MTFLTYEELVALTGRKTHKGQAKALNKMGITHTIRADGRVVVLTAHVEKRLDGAAASRKNKAPEPNWSAMP